MIHSFPTLYIMGGCVVVVVCVCGGGGYGLDVVVMDQFKVFIEKFGPKIVFLLNQI